MTQVLCLNSVCLCGPPKALRHAGAAEQHTSHPKTLHNGGQTLCAPCSRSSAAAFARAPAPRPRFAAAPSPLPPPPPASPSPPSSPEASEAEVEASEPDAGRSTRRRSSWPRRSCSASASRVPARRRPRRERTQVCNGLQMVTRSSGLLLSAQVAGQPTRQAFGVCRLGSKRKYDDALQGRSPQM